MTSNPPLASRLQNSSDHLPKKTPECHCERAKQSRASCSAYRDCFLAALVAMTIKLDRELLDQDTSRCSSGGLSGDKPRHDRGHGRQRRPHRRFALFGPVGEALGADDLDILDADEAEDRAQVGLLKVVGLIWHPRPVEAAARR